jgi:hypothetical protein
MIAVPGKVLGGEELEEAIREVARFVVYDPKLKGEKPPNVNEHRTAVMSGLRKKGIKAKAGRLQQRVVDILDEPEFADLRLPPGRRWSTSKPS